MTIVGYLTMSLVGLVLGLIGGGGAILTMPILAYLFSVPPMLATSYSLFVVGVASIFGVWRYHVQRLVDYRTAMIFVFPSFLGTYGARRLLLPAIPDVVFDSASFLLRKDQLIMGVFALVMVSASWSMIKKKQSSGVADGPQERHISKLSVLGFLVGFLAGFVGAGGGFLIIPSLVIWGRLPMNGAVATSLFIIAANSLVAFGGDLWGHVELDWSFLMGLTAAAALGLFFGVRLSRQVSPAVLKAGFGWFVLVMGAFILLKQLI